MGLWTHKVCRKGFRKFKNKGQVIDIKFMISWMFRCREKKATLGMRKK